MKTDLQLQTDVAAELKWEPRLNSDEIGVTVKDGVVTLTGSVPDYVQRRMAAKAANVARAVIGGEAHLISQ